MYYTHLKQARQVLITALMVAPLIICAATAFILSTPGVSLFAKPNLVAFLAPIVAGVAVHFICETFCYNLRPVPAGTPRHETKSHVIGVDQSAVILRFALSEAILIGTLGYTFAFAAYTPDAPGTFIPLLVATLVAETLMAYHVYPTERLITRHEEILNSSGGQSHLRELFGYAPWTGTDADKPLLGVAEPTKQP